MIQYLITALIDFTLSALAYSKRKKNKAALSLSLLALSAGIWSIELFLLTSVKDLKNLEIWFHATRPGMFFIPPLLMLLTWELTNRKSKAFFRYVVIPSLVSSSIISIANITFYPSKLRLADGGYLPEIDFIYYAFTATFSWCLISSIIFSFIHYKTANLRTRNRILWLSVTLITTLFNGMASIYLMIFDFYLSKFIGSVTNIIFISMLFYSTIQHHLMDIRLAVSEGLSRIILLGFFVWVYFLLVSLMGNHSQSTEGLFFTAIFIIAMLEIYPKCLRWMLPNTKKIFSKDDFDTDKVIHNLEKSLNDALNMKMLLTSCDTLVRKILKIRSHKLMIFPLNQRKDIELKTLCLFARTQHDIIFADESPEEIQEILKSKSASLYFTITEEDKDIAIFLVGNPIKTRHYSYSHIQIFQFLKRSLGDVISRIGYLDSMQEDLEQAKKQLSILSVINQYHHDIKAPLAIIDGIITADVYDKKKQKKVVLEQVDRASKLITTMADILHGERKREVAVVNMEEVIKDSVGLFAHSIDSVMYHFDDIPHISGEKEDLKILVLNVIKNSIEAKREGYAIRLTISAWTDQHGLFIKFEDNGVGIPKEQLDKIWTEYTTTKVSGSGIGLQAVKRIADEHGATINVVSSVDTGTAFTFTFPASILVRSKRKPGKIIDGGWPKSS